MTSEIGHVPTSLLDDDRAGSGIPRLQIKFPEPIEPSGGYVTQIERCGAQPAHGARLRHEFPEETDKFWNPLLDVVGKACHEEGFHQYRLVRDMDRAPVQKCPNPALADKELFARGIVNCANYSLALDFERERRTEDRQAVRVVRGAIDRIEDPAVGCPCRSCILSKLFSQNGVVGK